MKNNMNVRGVNKTVVEKVLRVFKKSDILSIYSTDGDEYVIITEWDGISVSKWIIPEADLLSENLQYDDYELIIM